MKKTFTIVFLALLTFACNRKMNAAAREEKAKSEAAAAAHTELVAQGKTVYTGKCGKCHALKTVENYNAERWTGILKSMIPKAKLNETESQQVTAYVMENAKKS
jgi:mono/diheme cytochrome c family protein